MGTEYNNCQPFSINPETQSHIEEVNKRPSGKKRLAILGAIVACVIAIIVVVIVLLISGKGYDKVIDKSLEVCKNPSVESIEDIYPEQMWSYMVEMYSIIDADVEKAEDIIEKYLLPETQKISDKMSEDFGEDWSLDYEVISTDELSNEVCEQIAMDIKKSADGEIKVKEAHKVNLYYTIEGSKTSDGFVSFVAVKIDGEWYAAEQMPNGWMVTILEF